MTTKRGLKLNEAGKAKVRHAVKKATTLEDLGEIDKALDSGRISDELATRLELISSDFESARTPAAMPLGAQVLTPGGLMKVRSFIEQATDLDRLAEVDKALNAGDVFRLRIMLNLQPQDIREPGEEPEEVEEDYDPFATLPSAEASADIEAKEGPPKKKAKEKKLKRARSKQDGGLGNLQSAYDESSGGSAKAADPSKRKRQKSAEEPPAPAPQELAWPMAWAWLLSRTQQHPEFRAPPISSGTKWAEEAAPKDASEPRLAIAITTSLVYAGDVASGYDPRHLARVVAVDQSGKLLLDLTVRPRSKLLDCRTHITGLSKEALEGPEAVSFDEARAQLLELLRPRTILVGHRLSQDLEALQLWHGPLLDISLLFPVDTRKKYQYHPLPYIGERVLLIAAPPEDSDLGPQDAIEMARLAMRLAVHEAAQPAPTNPFEPRQSSGREMVVRHIPASWGKAAVERLVEAIPGVSSDVKVRWMLNETDPTDWRGEARVFFTSARGRDDSFRASRGLTDVHVQWEDAPGAPPLGAFLTEQALIEAFSSFGMVVCARIPRRPTTQEPQSFAFVSFLDCEDAHRVSKKPAVEVPITGTWTVELRPRLAKFGNSSDKRVAVKTGLGIDEVGFDWIHLIKR